MVEARPCVCLTLTLAVEPFEQETGCVKDIAATLFRVIRDGVIVQVSCDTDLRLAQHLAFPYPMPGVACPVCELPQALLTCAREANVDIQVSGMTASCDAWFYNNQLDIPTVVYGPGWLKYAHSKDEQIELQDISRAAEVLVRLILHYCE